jgi:hypothetical protein
VNAIPNRARPAARAAPRGTGGMAGRQITLVADGAALAEDSTAHPG